MPVSELRQVLLALERVRQLLIEPSPNRIEECAACLQEAVGHMMAVENDVRNELAGGSEKVVPGLRMEVEFVRRELRNVNSLLGQAAAFHLNWAGTLGLLGSGYTASGERTAVSAPGKLAVRG